MKKESWISRAKAESLPYEIMQLQKELREDEDNLRKKRFKLIKLYKKYYN